MNRGFLATITTLFSLTDEQAMWRVQMDDDAHAFSVIVQRWRRPLESMCARLTGSVHRAEDIAQETFARIYSRRKAYRQSGSFACYIRRIAINLCYDELRRNQRRRETPYEEFDTEDAATGPALAHVESTPVDFMEREERARHVRVALMQLPETYRSVLILRHYEDLKFREIAEVLDLPEGTVKSRMAEGLNLLGRALGRKLDQSAGANPKRELILL